MGCIEECGGLIDKKINIRVKTGGFFHGLAHPCNKCGRLHWNNRNGGVYKKDGQKAFFNNWIFFDIDDNEKNHHD